MYIDKDIIKNSSAGESAKLINASFNFFCRAFFIITVKNNIAETAAITYEAAVKPNKTVSTIMLSMVEAMLINSASTALYFVKQEIAKDDSNKIEKGMSIFN